MRDRLSKIVWPAMALIMGCSKTPSTNDQVVRISFPKIKLVLDPHKMEDAFSMAVNGQIYRGLFRFNAQGDVVTDLAESFTESPDHLSYIIKLKSSQFSDGTKITSHHVQMSFARMFYVGSSMGADLDSISGVKKFMTTKNISDLGIKAISDSVVEFNLRRSSALFIKQLAVVDSAVLPLNDFKETLSPTVFSGPFKVTHQTTSSLEISKWRKDSLDSPNPPEKIVYLLTDKKPVDLAISGETDSLDHDSVPQDIQDKLLKSGWIKTASELVREFFIILNPNTIPAKTREYLYSRVNIAKP